jgi:hypothetical protein
MMPTTADREGTIPNGTLRGHWNVGCVVQFSQDGNPDTVVIALKGRSRRMKVNRVMKATKRFIMVEVGSKHRCIRVNFKQ